MSCCFVPPYLLERIAATHPDPSVVAALRASLTVDSQLRAQRGRAATSVAVPGAGAFAVYTASNGATLPGAEVRAADAPASGDPAVDEAHDGVADTLAMYADVLHRSSYDGQGAFVTATVHYRKDYDNAFWNGQQLVFGDGDGTVFGRFTKPVDVIGHEFTHAVTQFTAGLTYSDQPGALNESVSDVFGICVKQRLLGQTAAEADWLIGEGIFLRGVQGKALRSMKAPGTAYDDPRLGKDPQVGDMKDYVHTTSDNGGVHINSGIPNRAFYLAATAIGGNAWEGAGPIWYAALTSGIGADTDFAGFAAATLAAAQAVSDAAAAAVSSAWETVGVTGGTTPPAGTPADRAPGEDENEVSVVRSGGVAGITRHGRIVLGHDTRTDEVEALLTRIDLRGVAASEPAPDMFVYTFRIRGEQAVVGEQDLTAELADLARILLS
jgi:hypothetical protein